MNTAIHTVFVSGNSAPSLIYMTMEKLRHHNRKQKELRRLSRTESEVMELLSSPRGYSHKEIASKMYRSTATYWDLNTSIEKQKLIERRSFALQKWLKYNFPENIEGEYDFSDIGNTCIRVSIYLKKSESGTINLLKWLSNLKEKRWSIRKFWREGEGYFAYMAKKEIRNIDYILLFEDGANLDGCVISEKEITKKVFVTDCEVLERIL